MPRLDEARDDLIAALDSRYGRTSAPTAGLAGPEHVTLFERLAWVLLNEVATAKVATAAFDALDAAGLLAPEALGPANPLAIDDVLKQARVAMAIKSIRPLQNLARWAQGLVGPLTPAGLAPVATETIREEWRAINGIGLARADTLLLLGLGRLAYPVDRATYRIFVRHGWLDPTAEYDDARAVVERLATGVDGPGGEVAEVEAVPTLVHLGRWFDRVGREFCKPATPQCERCPLRPWLPERGPVEVE